MTERLVHALTSRVNRHGRVIASQDALCRELRTSPDTLENGLRQLSEARVVDILSPLPFLVLRLRSWPGSSRDHLRNKQPNSSAKADLHSEVPVSSSAAAAATQPREVGGAGEGEALLQEVLAVLGPEADREEFRAILAGHGAAVIHRCLSRVQATQAIRVSRAALFRSLLRRLSH